MAQAKKPHYFKAREAFVTFFEGEQVALAAGDLVDPDHPIVKGREELFTPWDGPRFSVEQATAAPGEKRGEPAKKPAAKKPAAPAEPAGDGG